MLPAHVRSSNDSLVQRDRRLVTGIAVSVLLHGLLLSLQFGVPGFDAGPGGPIQVRLATPEPTTAPEPLAPLAATPAPVPPSPMPLPPSPAPPRVPATGLRLVDPLPKPVGVAKAAVPKPATRKAAPRKLMKRRAPVSPPLIASTSQPDAPFAVAPPLPDIERDPMPSVDAAEPQEQTLPADAVLAAREDEAEREEAERLREEEAARIAAAEEQQRQLREEQERLAAAEREAAAQREGEALARREAALRDEEQRRVEQEQAQQRLVEQQQAEQQQSEQRAAEQRLAQQQAAERARLAQQQHEERRRIEAEQQRQAQLREREEALARQQAQQLAAERLAAEQLAAERLAAQEAERREAQAREREHAQELAQRQAAEERARRLAQERAETGRLAQERADEAARRAAAERMQAQALPGSGNAGPGGPGSGLGGGPGEGSRPAGGLPSGAVASRARELLRGLSIPNVAPPARPFEPPAGLRRVRADGAERDVPLRLYVDSVRQKLERNAVLGGARFALRDVRVDPLVSLSLRSDGSVDDVTIVRSSGRPDMDEAVRRFVQLNARYSAFPPNVAARFDVIEIRRVWTFAEGLKLLEEIR
ncbi:TonB family protein [Massilia consociata]|uniref:TonB family protein n=1 Tax=Massilia consociata TaxID=760117 RepID=A0ABV6FG00_9BURK